MTPYDLVEYPAKPFPQCHHDRLAMMARLFGLLPPPVADCRVLEVGCGDGLNLMASAMVLPRAQYLGIDLSASAVARGRTMAAELGVRQVRIEQMDLLSFDASEGPFDYVVAHGFYSWVPEVVREALLATIARVLSPNGIAMVSYNAYPGSYLRRMVREMASMFNGRDVAAARGWLESIPKLPGGPPLYRSVIADEAVDMLRRDDGALFHDDLAEVNEPFFFRDFMARSRAHGLAYVAEAELAGTGFAGLPAEVCDAFRSQDRLMREQSADFVRGRRFRQTLLCRDTNIVREEADATALSQCFVGGPITAGETHPDGRTEYASLTGGRVRTDSLADRMLLESIGAAWPCYVQLSSFHRDLWPRLLEYFAGNLVDIRTVSPPVAGVLIARPEASPLARLQVARRESATSLHHFEVKIETDSMRCVIALADGSRTVAQIARELGRMFPSAPKDKVSAAVDMHLEDLRKSGLLVQSG